MVEEEEKEMSFLDHLEELRWHLLRGLAGVVALTVWAFIRKDIVVDQVLLGPTRTDFWTYRMLCRLGDALQTSGLCVEKLDFILQNRTIGGQFTSHITISLVTGLVLGFPYLFWEVWRFVRPGLLQAERKLTRGAVLFVTLLFAAGVAFGYFVLAPMSINFLISYDVSEQNRIADTIDLGNYLSMLVSIVLACGIMFELPALMLVLARGGIVSARLLRQFRKHAFVVILIVAAVLTPSPDVISQLILAFPLYMLYELSILLAAGADRARRKQVLAQAYAEAEPEPGS